MSQPIEQAQTIFVNFTKRKNQMPKKKKEKKHDSEKLTMKLLRQHPEIMKLLFELDADRTLEEIKKQNGGKII